MKKPIYLVYGTVSHIVVLACFAYYALWNYGALIPKNVDSGTVGDPVVSFVIDLVILTLYCGAHSLLARWSVKQWMRRYFPQLLERATTAVLQLPAGRTLLRLAAAPARDLGR